jgi:hypothetical protein
MQLDWNQLNQGGQLDKVLSTLPYPLDKDQVIAKAQQAGTNPQVLKAIKQVLPDKTFNSAEDIKNVMQRH